jgi:GAF domain-containing protein
VVPDPEAARLSAVRDYNLIGTPPDAEFDRITALASRVFDVPVAVISIVGEDHVWLKSRQGIDATEIERSQGLGATGSLHEHTLVIEDIETDPRTQKLATSGGEPRFRFYAGVPLITSNGHNLGSLAIADVAPRHMSTAEIATLEDLAAIALHEMDLRRAARRVALGAFRSDG